MQGTVPVFWVRLDEPTLPAQEAPIDGWGAICDRLRMVLGCRWFWWVPDRAVAWPALMEALDVGHSRTVVAPFGADPLVGHSARGRGTRYVEIDLAPDSGQPRWDTVPSGLPGASRIWVADHRHGLPSPLPPASPGDLLIEDAAAAVGGAVAGQPVGSLGAAVVLSLGAPPFARSAGVVVGTARRAVATRLGEAIGGGVAPEVMWPALWTDATGVPDWVLGCRAAAQVYDSAWRGARLAVRPVGAAENVHATHSAYLMRVPDPDALIDALAQASVEACRPATVAFAGVLARPEPSHEGARAFYRDLIRLPNHPGLGLGELLYVADAVRVRLRGQGP